MNLLQEEEIERLEDRAKWLSSMDRKEKDVFTDEEDREYVVKLSESAHTRELYQVPVYLPITIQSNGRK